MGRCEPILKHHILPMVIDSGSLLPRRGVLSLSGQNLPVDGNGDAVISYRGYLIRRNGINGLIWVEKDGIAICYPFSFDDARQQIDALLS